MKDFRIKLQGFAYRNACQISVAALGTLALLIAAGIDDERMLNAVSISKLLEETGLIPPKES